MSRQNCFCPLGQCIHSLSNDLKQKRRTNITITTKVTTSTTAKVHMTKDTAHCAGKERFGMLGVNVNVSRQICQNEQTAGKGASTSLVFLSTVTAHFMKEVCVLSLLRKRWKCIERKLRKWEDWSALLSVMFQYTHVRMSSSFWKREYTILNVKIVQTFDYKQATSGTCTFLFSGIHKSTTPNWNGAAKLWQQNLEMQLCNVWDSFYLYRLITA